MFKNKLKSHLLETGIRKAGLGRWLKRIFITVVGIGLILTIGVVVLLGFTLSRVGSMVSAQPDTDLVALQHLMGEKAIVLSSQQKTEISPLVKELAGSPNNPGQTKMLKDKIWSILSPEQVTAAKKWKETTVESAGSLVESSKAPITEVISTYTGIPAEKLQKPFDSLTSWFQLKNPQNNSAEQLLQNLEGK